MPKQIILEYPWKATLNQRMYEVTNYKSLDNDPFVIVTSSNVSDAKYKDEFHYEYYSFESQQSMDALKSIIHQCQTELNN
jgi:hypothetical protein